MSRQEHDDLDNAADIRHGCVSLAPAPTGIREFDVTTSGGHVRVLVFHARERHRRIVAVKACHGRNHINYADLGRHVGGLPDATHAPAQPIPRKSLAADSRRVKKKREEFFFRVPDRKLDSAWVYDYAARELRRTQELDDPDRIFRNGLAGFPPDLDLAEALVEMALDDGAEQDKARAFGHAYTDRTGNVFTGLTLYDAWASGSNMEMPDIDNLGILHDNKVYNPDGKMMVLCGNGKGIGSHGPITAKLLTEAEFQATGADPGTTVHVTPEYDEIIGWARGILEPLQE